MELRHLDITGSLEELRERLRTALCHEERIRLLLEQVQHSEGVGAALFLVMQAVPCILHCENRVSLKILLMLLMEGFSNAQAGHILSGTCKSKRKHCKACSKLVENIINTHILGDKFDPVQWECPTTDDGLMVGAITLDNNKARKIVENIEELADLSFACSDRKYQFLFAVRKYNAALGILRQKQEYIDEDIVNFQSNVDDFFQVWIQLFSQAGCTNYIHFLASGHIAEYMFRWRNLHCFSQQGWENFNSLLKVFFFRRTAHGGPSGRESGGPKSKLRPIGCWLQRRLLWMCGIADQLFQSNVSGNLDDISDTDSVDDIYT
jgi:hypothetical protein